MVATSNRPRMVSPVNSALPAERVFAPRKTAASVAISAVLLGTVPAAIAQDQQAPPSLEDLIPDSAVDNPEAWAIDGSGPEVSPTAIANAPADDGVTELDGDAQMAVAAAAPEPEDPASLSVDSPLPDLPQLTVEWPDTMALPPVERLEPESGVMFADSDAAPLPPIPDGDIVRLDDALVLAFPQGVDQFPERQIFVERFQALSTVEELGGDADNIAQLAARARSDEELLTRLLRIYGYYDAQVLRSVDSPDTRRSEGAGDGVAGVRFDIIPGTHYRFDAINLGQLSDAPDAAMLRSRFGIQTGDLINSDVIVAERADLGNALDENGYPFAEVSEPELVIDHAVETGDLMMPVSPNGKYVFGSVNSSLPEFLSGRHFGTIARFDPGDVYQLSLQDDLRRAILATGLVSSVVVTPREVDAPSDGEPGTVALDVDIEKSRLRTVAGAIGYGTEEGFRLEASWEHRNFFPPEGALKFRGIVGTQEQLAGVSFRRNNLGGRDRILTLDAYASTIDSPAFDANTVAFVANYARVSNLLFQKPLSWSIGLELIATEERPPSLNGTTQPRESFFVAALPGAVQLDTSDSLLDPTEGFRIGARISPEVSRNNSAQSFYVRSQVDASTYQAVTDSVIIAGRARFASIPGTDLQNIAPSRRLYAGGGGSVRGYGFREIGPRNALGEPSGGRSLAEFSLEARVRTGLLEGAVSVVPFVDAGTVGTGATPDFDTFRIGAGLGVRYHTGFGPLRLDVGVPLNPGPDDGPVAVYVSLGQAF